MLASSECMLIASLCACCFHRRRMPASSECMLIACLCVHAVSTGEGCLPPRAYGASGIPTASKLPTAAYTDHLVLPRRVRCASTRMR